MLTPVKISSVYFSGAVITSILGWKPDSVCSLVYTSLVFAFKFSVESTLVVPASKLPETVKSTAVAVPVKAGLAFGAYDPNPLELILLPNSVIISILFTTNESLIVSLAFLVDILKSNVPASIHASVNVEP